MRSTAFFIATLISVASADPFHLGVWVQDPHSDGSIVASLRIWFGDGKLCFVFVVCLYRLLNTRNLMSYLDPEQARPLLVPLSRPKYG